MRPAAKNTVCRFQSTLSVRRATFLFTAPGEPLDISIHALRKESDLLASAATDRRQEFQSTLSVRRATRSRPV